VATQRNLFSLLFRFFVLFLYWLRYPCCYLYHRLGCLCCYILQRLGCLYCHFHHGFGCSSLYKTWCGCVSSHSTIQVICWCCFNPINSKCSAIKTIENHTHRIDQLQQNISESSKAAYQEFDKRISLLQERASRAEAGEALALQLLKSQEMKLTECLVLNEENF
jgi:hypothetical protein